MSIHLKDVLRHTFYIRVLICSWSVDEMANDQINVTAEHDQSTAGSSQTDVGLDVSCRTLNESPLPIGCIKNAVDATVYET